MKRPSNSSLLPVARQLRKNMTKEERLLWYSFLRDYPIKFRKQTVIGDYVVDFFCHKASLVIELDGSQHYEPEAMEKDQRRTDYLSSQGLTVLRISNRDVNQNFVSVCEYIDRIVKEAVPS